MQSLGDPAPPPGPEPTCWGSSLITPVLPRRMRLFFSADSFLFSLDGELDVRCSFSSGISGRRRRRRGGEEEVRTTETDGQRTRRERRVERATDRKRDRQRDGGEDR